MRLNMFRKLTQRFRKNKKKLMMTQLSTANTKSKDTKQKASRKLKQLTPYMNIFIFDSKVTDHVGRLASYSHYLFLFLCRLHQKLQLTKHLWLKSQSIFSSWHRPITL